MATYCKNAFFVLNPAGLGCLLALLRGAGVEAPNASAVEGLVMQLQRSRQYSGGGFCVVRLRSKRLTIKWSFADKFFNLVNLGD